MEPMTPEQSADDERDKIVKWLRDGATRIDPKHEDIVAHISMKIAASIEANVYRS